MLTIVLFLVAGLLMITFLIPLARRGTGRQDSAVESEHWRPVDAEVVSILRASSRTFLLVRYPVGTQFLHRDVKYPLAGAIPNVGQRVPVRYDPVLPARVVFDLHRAGDTPSKVPA